MTHDRRLAIKVALGLLALGCGDAQVDATTGGGNDSEAAIKSFGTCVEGGGGTVPANLDDALVELERILEPAHVTEVKRRDPIEFHHGLGTALRNCWGLWAGGSDLAGWFAKQGITHPDDMSSIVLTSFHRKLGGKELDVAGQIAKHEAYWKKQREDYEQGTSSGNSFFTVIEFAEGAGWVSIHGDNIPRVGELFTPLIDHARTAVEACWKKLQKTPGNSAVDTTFEISIDAEGRLATAVVVDAAVPETDATCLAQAMIGAAIPEHKGASYAIALQTYRASVPTP
ncbi:MAG: hypothetical protein JRF63_01620 [Deltaproteobacteria bacterium]|nr:hypothetical protein [Deltaproteobacteria bacterium]